VELASSYKKKYIFFIRVSGTFQPDILIRRPEVDFYSGTLNFFNFIKKTSREVEGTRGGFFLIKLKKFFPPLF